MGLGFLCFLPGCIDDNYDLSDIDTTSKININNLTLPINIAPVELQSIFDIKEGDKIQVVDGQYAILENGTFQTNQIEVEKVRLNAPYVAPATHSAIARGGTWDITASGLSSFDYVANNVSESIVSVTKVASSFSLRYDMTFNGINANGNIEDLHLQLPKGLFLKDSDNYNSNTGEYVAANTPINNGKASILIEAYGMSAQEAGLVFNYPEHSAHMHSSTGVISGTAHVQSASIKEDLQIHTEYTLSDIVINSFSGQIKYDINGINFTDIDL